MAPPRKERLPVRACDQCGVVSDNFQGRNGICRVCAAKRMRERRAANPERTRAEYQRSHERHREKERLAAQERRAADPEKAREIWRRSQRKARAENPERLRAHARKGAAKYRAEHPEKIREAGRWENQKGRYRLAKYARNTVREAIKQGLLTRPTTCERCGVVGPVEASHASYERDQWLVVRWLCRRCHRQEDAAQPKTRKEG